MYIRKKIKCNGKLYNISVHTYNNGRVKLKYENKNESHELTINLEDAYLEDGNIFLDPIVMKNGFLNALKKQKVIKEIKGMFNYNYVEIPVVKLNIGKLRELDYIGVSKHFEDKEDLILKQKD